MLTTDKEALASAALRIEILLNEGFLIENPTSGAIELHADMYTYMGKHVPYMGNRFHERAKELAEKYQKLWPSGVMSGGRPLRQGPATLTKKLVTFMRKHPKITDLEILSATERYVATKKKENYNFAACSDYFIEKNGSSLLEAYVANPELGSKSLETPQAINQRFV